MTLQSAWELFEHELRTVYDGHKRTLKALETIGKKAKHTELRTVLLDLKKQEDEHLQWTEEVFKLLDNGKKAEESTVVQGYLDDFKSIQSDRPSQEVLDLAILDVTSHIAQYTMTEYEEMEKLAERAGIHQSAPRVGDILQNTMKHLKKTTKKLDKLSEKLVEELRPA